MTKPHKHCPMCGTPIPMEEKFCSPNCEQIFTERQRKVAKTRKIMYIAFAALIIIYFLFAFKGKLY
ncbi:MAG: DUF2116 family Zn-ribbon domain-containing protein [Methanobacterium sp.]|uniref:DUF2116 family Zn-ribbon domain-containing protein n=1 Tax=Methanobacterium sp. TaxID=2164 RepID=UPI003D64A8CE|nr:DUF2116 family Zn-ribbon domain-containing protein [Methanobacterium sp.]